MKSFGWIYLLPSEAINVIVKYHPKWLISCVIPETFRRITAKRVDYRTDEAHEGKLDIKTPDIIFTHSIAKPWTKYSKADPYFSINRIDLKKGGGIHATPYQLSNVYSSGQVCFGGTAFNGMPKNLREANNLFWSTPFNEDNCPFFENHPSVCKNKDHEFLDHPQIPTSKSRPFGWGTPAWKRPRATAIKGCRCECCINECGCQCKCNLNKGFFDWLKNYYTIVTNKKTTVKTKYFCGEKYFACPKPTKAIFISNKEALLKKIPETHWRKDGQHATVIIGVAEIKNDTHWKVDLGSTSFSIPKSQVTFM